MAGGVWKLYMASPTDDWVLVDVFESLAIAAARIAEIEGYATKGMSFDCYVDEITTDTDSLSCFEHKGRKYHYVVRRTAH